MEIFQFFLFERLKEPSNKLWHHTFSYLHNMWNESERSELEHADTLTTFNVGFFSTDWKTYHNRVLFGVF